MDPMTALLVGAGGRALSRFGGQALADKVADLVGLQRAEIKLLKSLNMDLDRILAAPFLKATRLVEDAGKPWRREEKALVLLDEARSSLTEALSLDKNPLRLSLSALLLAAVWQALESPNDADERLLEAYDHAVDAARAMADLDPPTAGALRTRLGLQRKTRPRAVRLAGRYEFGLVGITIMRVSTYSATRAARRQERDLRRLHDYVQWLRAQLLERGTESTRIPEYRPVLEKSFRAALQPVVPFVADQQVYALRYVRAAGDTSDRLSADQRRAVVDFLPTFGRPRFGKRALARAGHVEKGRVEGGGP